MLDPKQFKTISIGTLDEGHEVVAYIDRRVSELSVAMRNEGSIPDWQKLSDERHELEEAKPLIQEQMKELAASQRDARAAVQEDEMQQDGAL